MLTLLLSLASAGSAPPKPAPVLAWPVGKPTLYHLETAIFSPRGLQVYALNNLDAQANGLQVAADVTCTAAMEGKVTAATCTFAHLKITGNPLLAKDAADLATILTEWTERTRKTRVILRLSKDGKLLEFDLEGLDRPDARAGSVNESIETLVQRTFAVFDLKLPPAGDDWIRGWELTSVTPVLYLPSGSGTLGSARVKFSPKGEEDGLYAIPYGGKASLQEGAMADNSAGMVQDARIAGTVLWDMRQNLMAYRDLLLESYYTVSGAESGSGAVYGITSAAQLVEAFNPDGAPPLPISALRAPKVQTPPPELTDDAPLVAFADLGMANLFVPVFPPEGEGLGLRTAKMKARVVVEADGRVRSVAVYEGYQALADATEQALKGAIFAVKDGKPYTVDVELEFRKP